MGLRFQHAQRPDRAIGALSGAGELRRTLGIEKAVQRMLVGGVMPLWLGAGLADWNLHRRTRIEETAGPQESLIHLTFAQTGVPVLLGLFCEVNAGVLATAYGAAGVHWATTFWNQAYAEERRRVSPVEQQVHSVLEMSPVTAAFLLSALHWDQARALAGQDSSRPRFAILLKRRDPLAPSTRAILLAAIALFGVLPYAEELWRCWQARPTAKPLTTQPNPQPRRCSDDNRPPP